MRRAIDIREDEEIDAPALKALIRAAVALNVSGRKVYVIDADVRAISTNTGRLTSVDRDYDRFSGCRG